MVDKTRVLVFRIGSLGDTCVAIPSFNLIRMSFKNSDIRVLTNFPIGNGIKAAPLKLVLGESGLVDDYFEYPVYGQGSQFNFIRCAIELRKWSPDVLVYLVSKRTRLQALRDFVFFRCLIGIPRMVGLSLNYKVSEHKWDEARQLYESESSRLVRSLAQLGEINLSEQSISNLGLQASEIKRAVELLENWEGSNNYIACSIGTKRDLNDWEELRWVEWVEVIARDYPQLGLVFVGVSVEFERSERMLKHWQGPALNLCGKLTPRESAEILRCARGFVGHDSGPMHLAAAMGTQCVAIFSGRCKPGIWFPFGEHHEVLYHKTDCFGCNLEVCEKFQKKCIRSITVYEVVKATKLMLSRTEKWNEN